MKWKGIKSRKNNLRQCVYKDPYSSRNYNLRYILTFIIFRNLLLRALEPYPFHRKNKI